MNFAPDYTKNPPTELLSVKVYCYGELEKLRKFTKRNFVRWEGWCLHVELRLRAHGDESDAFYGIKKYFFIVEIFNFEVSKIAGKMLGAEFLGHF